MKWKIQNIAIYSVSIFVCTIISVQIGSELITQYSVHANGYSDIENHHLADDMGFGLLLMLGLIPEIITGVIAGIFFGKKLNAKFKST